MSYKLYYTGEGYPSKVEIDREAFKKGFTHSFWASKIGFPETTMEILL